MAKYFTMMVKEPGGEWCPEFETTSYAEAADEMSCSEKNLGHGYGFAKGTKFKIVAATAT